METFGKRHLKIDHYCQEGTLKKIKDCSCEHNLETLLHVDTLGVVISGRQYLAVNCHHCRMIRLYSLVHEIVAHHAYKYSNTKMQLCNMCLGPQDTIIVTNHEDNARSVCVFNCSSPKLTLIRTIHVKCEPPCRVHYSYGNLYMSYGATGEIIAINFNTGEPVWSFRGEVDSKTCVPWGMCTDPHGRLYVADCSNLRVLVFGAASGKHLQTIKVPRAGYVYNVAWKTCQDHLMIWDGVKHQIIHFCIKEDS